MVDNPSSQRMIDNRKMIQKVNSRLDKIQVSKSQADSEIFIEQLNQKLNILEGKLKIYHTRSKESRSEWEVAQIQAVHLVEDQDACSHRLALAEQENDNYWSRFSEDKRDFEKESALWDMERRREAELEKQKLEVGKHNEKMGGMKAVAEEIQAEHADLIDMTVELNARLATAHKEGWAEATYAQRTGA